MPYCPTCYTEYQEGVAVCADDGTPLVAGTPQFCSHCEQFVPEVAVFCPSCGRVQPIPEGVEPPECDNHPEVDAVSGCVVCGKPLCDDCQKLIDDVVYCDDDQHEQIRREFVEVYQTTTDYEAEMLRANLEGAGIDAMVFNQHDHVYFVNLGGLAVVKIMARRKDAERAQELIASIVDSDEDADEKADTGEEA